MAASSPAPIVLPRRREHSFGSPPSRGHIGRRSDMTASSSTRVVLLRRRDLCETPACAPAKAGAQGHAYRKSLFCLTLGSGLRRNTATRYVVDETFAEVSRRREPGPGSPPSRRRIDRRSDMAASSHARVVLLRRQEPRATGDNACDPGLLPSQEHGLPFGVADPHAAAGIAARARLIRPPGAVRRRRYLGGEACA